MTSSLRKSMASSSAMATVLVLLVAVLMGGIPGAVVSGADEEAAGGETVTLPWCKPDVPANYTTRSIKAGDTVVFEWFGEYHNAWYYPTGDCMDRADRKFLGEQSPASYEFGEEDVGTTMTFVCDVSNHCQVGQYVTFDVVGADEEIEYVLETPCGSDGRLASAEAESGGVRNAAAATAGATAAAWIVGGLLAA